VTEREKEGAPRRLKGEEGGKNSDKELTLGEKTEMDLIEKGALETTASSPLPRA